MNEPEAGDSTRELAKKYHPEELSVEELSGFLRKLSVLFQGPQVGNPALSGALAQLARSLQRFSGRPIQDVLANITIASKPKQKRGRLTANRLHGVELPSLRLEDVKELLSSQNLTREDLIRIGNERFGIPKSSLERRKKEEVLDAVEVALRNEESLDIISHEANREGMRRSG